MINVMRSAADESGQGSYTVPVGPHCCMLRHT